MGLKIIMTLAQSKQNAKYTITQTGNNRRLFEYGFFAGAKVFILGFSPKKQSILVFINGGMVALRLSLAELVSVVENNDSSDK